MTVQPSSPEKIGAYGNKTVQFDVEKQEVEVEEKRRGSWFSRRRAKPADDEDPLIDVSTKELLKLNIPDWFLVVPGVVGSAIIGVLFPTIAILFSGVLEVRAVSLLACLRVCSSSLALPIEKPCCREWRSMRGGSCCWPWGPVWLSSRPPPASRWQERD